MARRALAALVCVAAGVACAVGSLDESGKTCTDTCPSGLPCVDGVCGGPAADGAPPDARSDGPAAEAGPSEGSVDAVDAPPEAAPPSCNVTADFGTPVVVSEVASPSEDMVVDLAPDELTMYVASNRDGQGSHLYYTTRTTRGASWGALVSLLPIGAYDDWSIAITRDGLTGVLSSDRGGSNDLFILTRSSVFATFGGATPAAALNSSSDDAAPKWSADGKTIYFDSTRTGARDLYVADALGTGFGAPRPITELNTPDLEAAAVPSADELTIYFLSQRAPSPDGDVYVATRASKGAPFGAPKQVPGINSSALDVPGWISPDGCTIYLSSTRVGGHYDVYVARRPP
jgi:Tol biopolymer transport system component